MRLSTSLRLNAQKGLVTPYDPTLTLSLQFAARQAYVSDFGPLPTFTNASTTRTFVGSDGLLKTAATNVPRIEFDPITRQCLGLLIEEQRSNLTAWSEDVTNASWSKGGTSATGNTTVAPDGNSSADTLTEAAVSTQHYTYSAPGSVTSGTTYTASVFLKKGSGATAPDWVAVGFLSAGFGSKGIAFNVSTGAFGVANGSLVGTAKQYPNGWWRVSFTAAAVSSGTHAAVYIGFTNNTNTAGSPTYVGQTTSDIFIWGAQFEAGFFASSYIPTVGTAPLTRSADVCSITGAAFTGFWNASEGTILVKAARLTGNNSAGSSGFPRYLSFDDGTVTNRIHAWWFGGPNQYGVTVASVDSAALALATVTGGTSFGIAARYKANDFAASQDGGAVGTDVSGSLPTVTALGIGQASSGGGVINGHIRAVQYFNEIKTNAQLQALSTP